ncbi:DUF1648 domain-containing protein [Parvibacter caecicola]|uniref:DUF1648 domain-containing protein n=1 Tax=Parvibacter caecicola TaxID=747645 RepID=UPI002730711C|nr:DUF5808 domain-containing protein [Parvibacter caecicola]
MPFFGSDQGVAVIQALMWMLWALVPVVGIMMALTPYLMPKRECFAVTVPDTAQQDPYLKGLKRRFLVWVLAATALLSVVLAAVLAWGAVPVFIVLLTVGLLVISLGGYLLMLRFRRQVQAYKKAQGWQAEAVRRVGFAGPEDFPKPLSLKWALAYIPLILFVLALGIVGYPTMPGKIPMNIGMDGQIVHYAEKSFVLVLFPVLFCLFMAVIFTFNQWMILRSKKATDPSMPAASAWAYGMFARAQSILLVAMGLVLVGAVGILLQLAMVGVLSIFDAALAVLPIVFVIIVASTAVNLVYGQNGARLLTRVDGGDGLLRDDDSHWKLGIFYFNREDASLFLPERFGIGWTVNFARPAVWTILAALVLLIVAFIVFCLVAT